MADMETIQRRVRERLGELEKEIEVLRGEFEQLKTVAAILETASGRSRPAGPRARRTPAQKLSGPPPTSSEGRASGKRARQALEHIGAKPGITALDLAAAMGIKRNYLYRVLPALQQEGKITKAGKGYHLAADRARVSS